MPASDQHQGYRGDSCWSRGLAWSLYGFTRTYRQTGRAEYPRNAEARRCLLLAHLPADGVTPWTFDAPLRGPLSRSQVDTSAAPSHRPACSTSPTPARTR